MDTENKTCSVQLNGVECTAEATRFHRIACPHGHESIEGSCAEHEKWVYLPIDWWCQTCLTGDDPHKCPTTTAPTVQEDYFGWATAQMVADYELAGLHCPGCGERPSLVTGDIAWCGNDPGCKVVSWHPGQTIGWHRSHVQQVDLGGGMNAEGDG